MNERTGLQGKYTNRFFGPNALLLFNLVLMVFFVPVFPFTNLMIVYNFLFSCIFLLSAWSLQHKRRNIQIAFAFLLIVITWLSYEIDNSNLTEFSRIAQGLFFGFIIIRLIKQTVAASKVNLRVIADSISGYLLVGIIYALIAYSIVNARPDAYRFLDGNNLNKHVEMSDMFYFTFVTYSSTGYGDIIPIHPIAKSFATLISVTGQMYIAVIIALLVGKFSSNRINED